MYDAYDLLEADAYEEWDAGSDFDAFDEDAFFEDEMLGFEDDEFLGRAWAALRRQVTTPGSTLRRAAFGAARGAVQAAGKAGGTALGSYLTPRLGDSWGRAVGDIVGGAAGGLAAAIPDKMDEFAALAAEAEDEAEAEAFLGALVPLAARLLPQAGRAIMRVAPHLIRGLAGTAQAVHANPAARQLLRTSGAVVRRTAADIARQAAQGRPVSGRAAVRQLARNTYRVMGNPRQVRRAMAQAPRHARQARLH